MKNPFLRFSKNKERSPNGTPSQVVGKAKTQSVPISWLSWYYLPRKHGNVRNLDINSFKNYSLNDVLDILRRNHPETSMAIWQFLRVSNSGITCKAKTLTGEDSPRGQRALDRLLWQLNHPPTTGRFEQARGLDMLTGQLLANAMLRGGAGCELVLNPLGRTDRITAYDAGTIHFKSEEGRIIPYQQQLNSTAGYVKIDYPTVFYQPLDPDPDDIYGTSPLMPLAHIIVFQIQFLNDLQAAVHQVGYPRISAELLEEIAKKNAPAHIQNDPAKYKEWTDRILSDTQSMLRNLDPDDVLVHWDSLKFDLVGKGGGGQSIRIDSVISTIEKSLSAALKTMSSIIGIGSNTSKESYNAELKLYSRGVESVQKVAEHLLERALTMALNLEGVQGWVDVTFTPVDLRSELQVVAEKQTRQDIIITARMRGSISDYEEMKAHREVLGLIGEPEGWNDLVEERKEREKAGGRSEEYPRHGSPPANQ